MKTKMVKWGNSFAVRIPKPIVETAKLKEGDFLDVATASEGQIELARPTRIPSLTKLVSQITPENRYSEVSVGREVGREVVEW